MQFDDRLATVLRMRADSDAGLRTQFRQLVDLLGTAPDGGDAELLDNAYDRLDALTGALSADEQARILREPGLRLRHPRLIAFFAASEPKIAAAAMATARLGEADWLETIPALPVTARGFLRHRRNLPTEVGNLLARLGVGDLVLSAPDTESEPDPVLPTAPVEVTSRTPGPLVTTRDEIGALLRRIEAFHEGRRSQPVAPRLPLDDEAARRPLENFEFTTDASGTATRADDDVAPMVVGLRLTAPASNPLVAIGTRTATSLAARQPIHEAIVMLEAAAEISGEWLLDAAPMFDKLTGAFIGYRGCLRRPVPAEAAAVDPASDRMRQVLHELRTPVNAIQGFAEVIQQQVFGTAPHEYRAHAAAIAVDAAKLLAGFDEVDRLVKLETGAASLDGGSADLRRCVTETVERLQGVLEAREARFALEVEGTGHTVALDTAEAMALCWRLLATAAGALAPQEDATLTLSGRGDTVTLEMQLPRALATTGDAPPADSRPRAVSAGMFGPAFTFRLARAEAENAGGSLKCKDSGITLTLPALTAVEGDPSAGSGRAKG